MAFDYEIFFNLCLQYSDNLFLILSKDFTIRDINPTAERLLGWRKKDVLNKKIDNLFVETSVQPFISSQKKIKKFTTTTFSLNSGQNQMLIWDIVPVYDEQKECETIFVVGKNEVIADDQSLEDLQLENVLNYAPGLFYWKDKNSLYQGCNDEFARLAGLESRSQVKGKTDFELAWRDRAELYVDVDKKVIDSGIATLNHEEVIAISIDSKPMTAITSKVPLWNSDGEVIGLLGITMDITHQKEVERDLKMAKEAAEAANRAKTEFISNMSHDIRTPLTGVVGMAKMLENSVEDENQKQYAHWLGESGDQLLHMLNGILDVVSSDKANEDDLHEEPFTVKRMIQDIVELERPSVIMKGIDLITHLDEEIPAYLVSDHIKLHRILLNLLGNAIKFTDTGYVEIKVMLLKQHKNKVTLRFQVSDTGIGISPELQDKVFDQFFRIMPSYEGVYTGHGVGLHIAQSYAHLLGSNIQLKSELQVGTSFYFDIDLKVGEKNTDQADHITLPFEKSLPVPPTLSLKTLHEITNIPASAPHLLLVEDNKIALLMLENLVTQAGCHFTSAMDGEIALDLAKNNHFDLIITDLGLPNLSGIEFTRLWRSFEKEQHKHSLPIFGLTAHADHKIKSECLEAGMNKVLTKPMTSEILDNIKLNYFSLLCKPASPMDMNSPDANHSNLGPGLPDSEVELFALEHLPVLNIGQALPSIGNDMTLLKSILSAMAEEELPQDLQELYILHAKSDWDEIEKLAHRMKGGLVYCGTEKLVIACQYLERYRKAGHTHLLESLYQQVCTVADYTISMVRKWLETQTSDSHL